MRMFRSDLCLVLVIIMTCSTPRHRPHYRMMMRVVARDTAGDRSPDASLGDQRRRSEGQGQYSD